MNSDTYNAAMMRLNEVEARYQRGSRSAVLGIEDHGVQMEIELLIAYNLVVAKEIELDGMGRAVILEPTPIGINQIRACRRAWAEEIINAV